MVERKCKARELGRTCKSRFVFHCSKTVPVTDVVTRFYERARQGNVCSLTKRCRRFLSYREIKTSDRDLRPMIFYLHRPHCGSPLRSVTSRAAVLEGGPDSHVGLLHQRRREKAKERLIVTRAINMHQEPTNHFCKFKTCVTYLPAFVELCLHFIYWIVNGCTADKPTK